MAPYIRKEEKAANPVRYNLHPKRRNNDRVAAMYALYETGVSLKKVATVYGVTRQAAYDVFRTRKYPLRTKPLKDLTVVDGHRFSRAIDGYLRGTIAGRRVDLHRYVYEKKFGKVPDGCVLYHSDGDKLNNALSNLRVVKKKDMPATFNPGRHNQHTRKKERQGGGIGIHASLKN